MEHKPLEVLRNVADVHDAGQRFLSRQERLERWAEILERDPQRRLRSLEEIELIPRALKQDHRVDGSPLTVAFEDPVLRAEGLRSDKLGDAVEFFELSERQAHRLLCSCMNGWSMEAGTAARNIRRLAAPRSSLRSAAYALGAGLGGVPVLMYLLG